MLSFFFIFLFREANVFIWLSLPVELIQVHSSVTGRIVDK